MITLPRFCILPGPVALETEEQMLEREQNERDVLEALGEYCKYKFSTGWAVGVVKSVEKKKSVAGQFAVKYKSETYGWTKKLNREGYGVHKC